MPVVSAGLLLYRLIDGEPEVLLVHPGGPFWQGKDLGSWSVPKGEVDAGEDPLVAARREFAEETGFPVVGEARSLGEVRQRSGKRVHAWAVRGDVDPARLVSNDFELEWPPRSGRVQKFPEVDRAEWFNLDEARRRILPAQIPLIDRLSVLLG